MKAIKKRFARYLRKNQTKCEQVIWALVRDRRFQKFKFRRQHVIEGFIADFYCHAHKLVIEVDGWIHNKHKEYDRVREEILNSKGYKVIRIKNDDVVNNLDDVIRKLEYALTLDPSPHGRGQQI